MLEPATPYLHNWHIDAISEYLEAVTAGQITRLIINMPPRYMKSIAVSVLWPTWVWIEKPWLRSLFASYSQSLSTKHSLDRRTVIQSPWYQERWGSRFSLADDHNLKTEFTNNHRGHMIATSVGGTATGKGGDVLGVDDPVNPKEAHSDALRVAANTWFDQTFYTRLDNKKTGAIVVVMQRLHEQDLSGHLLQQGGWEHLKLPAEAKDRQTIVFPLSGRTVEREPGDIIWPEREGPEELAQTKRALGTYGYAGQYDQDPAPAGGGILKRHWWRYWQPKGANLPPVPVRLPDGTIELRQAVDLPDDLTDHLQSWDMAFKDTENSAYVVGQVWAYRGADKFLLDQVRDKMDFVATEAAVQMLTAKWPQAIAKLIEDKANGPAIISRLQHKIPGIIAIPAGDSKESRTHAVAPEIEAGNVYIPHPAVWPWVDAFLHEASTFPASTYKDQVDAMTQALARLQAAGVQIFV